MSMRRTLTTMLAAGAIVAASSAARAQTMPNCNDTTALPNPIYITGSTALEPMLKVIGPQMAADPNTPHTIVYNKSEGSCGGVAHLVAGGTTTLTTNLFYIPAGYNPATTPTPPQCTMPTGASVPITLVLSDVDPTLCPGAPQIQGFSDFHGPVNDMVFVVPSTSSQQAISAEDAYLVLGMGAAGMVTPWTNPMYYFIRTGDSGTRAMINANIGLGSHTWMGVTTNPSGKNSGSGDVFNYVAGNATMNTEATIGILGEDFYDQGQNRASVHALAFRAFHQRFAYWPDSTLTARDKKNVREGRYKIWGYVHILAPTSGGSAVSNITDAKAQYFVNLLQGTLSPAPAFDVTDAITDSHLTPVCAMKVTHDIEGADQKPFTPMAPCGCSFESRATGNATPAGCTPCSTSSPCATGVCRKGFCEAQ